MNQLKFWVRISYVSYLKLLVPLLPSSNNHTMYKSQCFVHSRILKGKRYLLIFKAHIFSTLCVFISRQQDKLIMGEDPRNLMLLAKTVLSGFQQFWSRNSENHYHSQKEVCFFPTRSMFLLK